MSVLKRFFIYKQIIRPDIGAEGIFPSVYIGRRETFPSCNGLNIKRARLTQHQYIAIVYQYYCICLILPMLDNI